MLPAVPSIGTVVVCEDDDVTRELLCENLTADRFTVFAAATAEAALRHCHYEEPDVLLLDLNLPDASGLDVLREIRTAAVATPFDPDLPIVVLSGRGSDDDRVRGLSEGASDYLVKPFHYPELLVRLRNQLAERPASRRGPRTIGSLSIDTATREVCIDGQRIHLSNKEFELLRALAVDPLRVFTKEELLSEVWGFHSVGRTRTLDSHASRLRRKLDPEGGQFVKNCWGVGYRLVEA